MNKLFLSLLGCVLCHTAFAATYQWTSKATGKSLSVTMTEAAKPALDANGKRMTVVYLENLSIEKIGQNTNAEDVAWLLGEGYRVIEIDYNNDKKAVSPDLTKDIIAINDELNDGKFANGKVTNISTNRSYILMEGYRIKRDVGYYLDDKTVYNLYSVNDSLYMDIVYPANPDRAVPTLLSFSYSNSYHGKEHQRMFLGYTLSMFDDAIQEGAAANGMAWAIADHPKYCDWGNGKVAGGANKSLGAIEVNPDAAKKVKAAVRTLRHFGSTVGLGDDIAVYGFSRGSTAASLAIGDAPFEEWITSDRCPYTEESSDVQAAVLGPGVFNYGSLPTSMREYTNMKTYAGNYSTSNPLWAQQGGALAIKNGAVPAFLFHNSNDEAYYIQQMNELIALYNKTNSTYEQLTDYGSGHSVPTDAAHLQRIYDFLKAHLHTTSAAIATPNYQKSANDGQWFDLQGRKLSVPCEKNVSSPYDKNAYTPCEKGIYIRNGKKIVVTR